MPKAWNPYPTEEPPGYNPDDPYADKIALVDHRHYQLGQYFIREARARILREKMKECYSTHGVNHVTECRDIVEKFWKAHQAVNLSWMDASAWKPAPEDPE